MSVSSERIVSDFEKSAVFSDVSRGASDAPSHANESRFSYTHQVDRYRKAGFLNSLKQTITALYGSMGYGWIMSELSGGTMTNQKRFACFLALALAGCGGSTPPAQPVTPPVTPVTMLLPVLEPDLTTAEIEAMKRQVPDPYPANDTFWRDKQGAFLNIYYHLYRPGKFKTTVMDFGSVSCKGSAALKAMMLDPSVGIYVTGDSIIAGGGVSTPDRSYIRLLMSDLAGKPFEMDVFPGRSLRNYLNDNTSGIYHRDLSNQIVIFAWGMNDHVYKDPSQFGADFRAFVSEAKARGAKHVIALSTIYPDPNWIVSDYPTIDAQNRALVASDFVTPLSVTAFTDPRTSKYMVLSEVNHPSDVGHMAHYVCLSSLYR